MTKRVFRGESPFMADNTHLHHKLMTLNLSHSGVVSVLYGCMFICGFLAVFMQPMREWVQFATGTGFFICLYATVALLQRRGFKFTNEVIEHDVKEHRHDFMQVISAHLRKSVPIATWFVPSSLIIPAGFLAVRGSDFGATPLLIGIIIMALYPWKSHHERLGWVHGLIYFATFTLLLFLNASGSLWINDYLKIVTYVVLIWVVMKLVFMQHSSIFLTSSFELLMIFIAWFIPVILTEAIDITEENKAILILSCLESIAFLLAMKIIIRREPSKNLNLVSCMIFTYFLIGVGSFFK